MNSSLQKFKMSKVKYSVTHVQNQKAIDALFVLYELHDSLKSKKGEKLVMNQKDFEKDVIKPLERLFLSRIERPKRTINPLGTEKEVSPAFIKIYRRLEEKGADLSEIEKAKEKKKASQITAYKMMNIYVKHFGLKNGQKAKNFPLDDFLKGCFDDNVLEELYLKNNSETITQGHLNKLASLLLIKN